MLAALIRFCLAQRLLVLLLGLGLAVAGALAFRDLPLDAFPDVSPTQVKIILKAPGMTPEEVEARLVAPLEAELLGIADQRMLRSVAKYGLADITLDFAEGTDIYWARAQVNERMAGLLGSLPPGVSGGVAPITTPLGDVFMFTLEGGGLSLAERRHVLDWVIRPALRTVPGVADVNALGGEVRAFEVVPDPERLAARGLDVEMLARALQANNRNDGAGRLNVGEEALLVRSEGRVRTLEDVAATVVARRGEVALTVGDVATVRLGALTRYGAVTHDGRGETVQGLVLALRGANAREVIDGVRARLGDLQPALPPGLDVKVFYDRRQLVDRALFTVGKALGEAVALVLILLVLLLGNPRAALVVALSLPLSALGTFFLMREAGLSANLMSLGGLAIAIGMLVDGAVVVVENIVRELERDAGPRPRLHLIYRATREVAAPVVSGIVIIMIVFLPLLTLEGLEGKLFRPVAMTILFALGTALVLSLTVVPVLASWVLPRVMRPQETRLMCLLERWHGATLARALRYPRTTAIVALLLMGLALGLYPRIGKTFLPTLDEGDLLVQFENLPSANLDETLALNTRLQAQLLAQVPEIAHIVARTGSDELGLDPMGLNDTDGFLVLRPREQWQVADKDALRERIREALAPFPGVNFAFTQPIEMRVSEMLTGTRGDLAVKVFGPDLAVLGRLADDIARLLAGIPGATDVVAPENEGMRYLNFIVDRQRAGDLGLDADTLADVLRVMVEGRVLGTVQEGGARTPLLLRANGSLQALEGLSLPVGEGLSPLSLFGRFEDTEGVVFVNREQASRFTVVRANVTGRDLGGFVEEARQHVSAELDLPEGYRIEWGGQFENQQRAAQRLERVVPVALMLIFLLLFMTFGSLRQSFLVFANIPFALIGGVVALWLSGQYLSVPASVGFIALLGIAVLNGVVLVSHFNQLRAMGLSLQQTVIEGTRRRLRPVLMTASIAALGLLPLLFAQGPGSEIQKPLAIVVVGGLVTATLLTLILLPLLYLRYAEPQARPEGAKA